MSLHHLPQHPARTADLAGAPGSAASPASPASTGSRTRTRALSRSRCRRPRHLAGILATALVTSSMLLLTACSGGSSGSGVTVVDVGDGGDSDSHGGLHGTVPAEALAKPALNLTDVQGRPFDLRQHTKGKITLLFFGYTKCPDVCPTTMADIAAALKEVKPDVRDQVSVVFVSTDPDRDTGEVLNRWLKQFDATFIGVRGPFERVRTEAEALGVPLEEPEVQADGSVLVTHGAQVIAFSRDDKIRALYLAGTGVQEYIDDLPKLTAERSGSEART